ncbi:MAG: type IV secretory system conjugative DNA transfer family protein [Streptosporangiaceae bacterium]
MAIYLILAVLVVAGLIWLHARATRYVPRNRVRAFRMRLHLGLRPGRGFATAFEIWLRWSRFAMWRGSKRIRPELTSWQRFRNPDAHSVKIGRAQRRQPLRADLQTHAVLTAAPRTGKTVALGAMLLEAPGAAVVTSSKVDLVLETSAIRAERGGPVEVLNPAGLGAIPSTIRIDIIDGCRDVATCVRRADAIASAVSMRGSDNGDYFSSKCSSYLRALFLAAAIVGGDARLVAKWAYGTAEPAEGILKSAGHGQWAAELAELRGPAEKSSATTKSLMTRALQFMQVPTLAEAVLPGQWDMEAFIRDRGTLYMVSDSGSDENPLAPLFSLIVTELAHVASVVGSKMPGTRLSPPLSLLLDEVTQICPIPLPRILSDAGGRGIRVVTVVHGYASLAERYGEHGAQTVMNTSGCKIWLGGSAEVKTLEMITKLCGQMAQRERGQDHHVRHDIVTEAMARGLPQGYAIVISGANAPVVARLERYYELSAYKRAKRHGGTLTTIEPAAKTLPAVQLHDVPSITRTETAPDPLRSMLRDTTPEPAAVTNAWGI